MLDQFLELYRSVADHPIDWHQWFVATHYVGLVVGLGAALFGDGFAVRVLLAGGRKPSRRRLRRVHAAILIGLGLLWVSGIGLIVQKYSLAGLPMKLVFKLAVATILSLNALMVRDVLVPISQRVRRPIASGLSVREALGVAVIGAVSIASWTALAGVAFVPALQALALETLFAIYGGMVGAVALTCLVAIGIVRLVKPRAPEGAPRRRRRAHAAPDDAGQPGPLPAPESNWAAPAFGAPQLVVSDDTRAHEHLTHRLRQTLAARQSNDNDSQVRERLERERVHQHRRADGGEGGGGRGSGLLARLTSGRGGGRRPERQRGEEAGLEPAPDDPDTGETSLTLRDIRARCRRALFGVAAVSLVSNLLMLTGPLFMLQIYDRVLTSQSLPTLTALFGLTVALFAFMGVLDLIRSRLLVRVGLRVDRLMNARIFDHAIAIASPADVKERAQLQKDLGQVRQFISGAGTTAIFDMPWVPVYFAIVVMFHDTLGAVALAGAGVLVVLSLANEFLSRKPVTMAAQHAAEADRLFEAGRQQREVLHAMGMMPRYRERWVARHSAELITNTRAADIAGLLSVATKIARLTLQAAMLAAGAFLVLAGEITPGVMIASSIIMSRALAPIEQGIAHWRSFIAARQGLQRLGAALEASAPQSRLRLPQPEGHLKVENLFACPIGSKEPVLKGLEFALSPGDALGVLGPSGSGKSTLARVLVGVWPVIRGRVCLDGAPLDHWPLEQVGEHIGYLPQDAMLFEGTVADNIARFDAKADPAAIIAAARTANVHDMILGLGDGYNTRVGEGGAVLSGGQRQRVALARALYGGPALVVLDEPNSNLDQAGEEALAEAIATMRRAGRTVIVMAHRRKALEHVSHILVLKDGRQSAFGDKATILGAARQSAEAKRRQANAAS